MAPNSGKHNGWSTHLGERRHSYCMKNVVPLLARFTASMKACYFLGKWEMNQKPENGSLSFEALLNFNGSVRYNTDTPSSLNQKKNTKSTKFYLICLTTVGFLY